MLNKVKQNKENIINNIYRCFCKLKTHTCLFIDPGMSNIGWCACNIKTFEIYDGGILKYTRTKELYETDTRVKDIFNDIQQIICKYNAETVFMEKIQYSAGKFSFTENTLIQGIGSIKSAILCLGTQLIEVTYPFSYKVCLGKFHNKKDKNKIKEFVVHYLKENKLSSKMINKLIKTKLNYDLSDAIFIFIAIYKIYKSTKY